MSLPRRTMLMRLVASVLCLLALSVYITFAPANIHAASCTCGGGIFWDATAGLDFSK